MSGSESGWRRRARRQSRPASRRLGKLGGTPHRRRASGPKLVAAGLVVAAVFATAPGQALLRTVTNGNNSGPTGFRLGGTDQSPQQAGSASPLPKLEHPVDPALPSAWPSEDEPAAALADSPWRDTTAFRDGQGAAFDRWAGWRPHSPYRALDFRTPLVNVIQGERLSWNSPACECRRVIVWMYGGSTTFGLNQRDDHTIASSLARVAHENGLTVDVHNRGAMGHLHWMEAERFALDLTVERPPDLVVFYDGANDFWATNNINVLGTIDSRWTFDPTMTDAWRRTGRSEPPVPPGPPGSRFLGLPAGPGLEQVDLERTTIERYDRSRRISSGLARHHGVTARFVWQPSRYSRDLVPDEPHGSGAEENYARMSDQLLRSFLPPDVIDLVDVFDDLSEPLFTDDVHHNERGARVVAEALFQHLEPDLRRAAKATATP